MRQSTSYKVIFAILMVFMIIINTGIWYMPNIEAQYDISQSLTFVPFAAPGSHFLMTNFLQPLVFNMIGGNCLYQYLIFTFIITVVYIVIFAIWLLQYHKNHPMENLYRLAAIFTFPVFMVPFYWIGMDGMVLLLMLLVMITLRSHWSIFFAFLLGIQHFEQGVVAFILLLGTFLYTYVFEGKRQYAVDIRKTVYILIALITGKLLLLVWFSYFHITLLDTRSTYLEENFSYVLHLWIDSWPFILYSLFGAGWVLIIKEYKILYPFLLSVVVAFVFLMFVSDQTRVGTIILFPSLMYWIFMNKELWCKVTNKLSIVMILLYFALPVVYVWGGWGGPFFGSLHRYDAEIIRKIKNPSYNINFVSPFKNNNNRWI